jgi:hypothetical protein
LTEEVDNRKTEPITVKLSKAEVAEYDRLALELGGQRSKAINYRLERGKAFDELQEVVVTEVKVRIALMKIEPGQVFDIAAIEQNAVFKALDALWVATVPLKKKTEIRAALWARRVEAKKLTKK